jgi:hypothetical protein|nr:MAG TPA: hypothetical protein [Caudoviricetes sp.]
MTQEIQRELDYIASSQFKLGEYIYMGMGTVGNHEVCMSVGYKIDYAIKKAKQFEEVDPNVKLTHINKVKVGKLVKERRFEL